MTSVTRSFGRVLFDLFQLVLLPARFFPFWKGLALDLPDSCYKRRLPPSANLELAVIPVGLSSFPDGL